MQDLSLMRYDIYDFLLVELPKQGAVWSHHLEIVDLHPKKWSEIQPECLSINKKVEEVQFKYNGFH